MKDEAEAAAAASRLAAEQAESARLAAEDKVTRARGDAQTAIAARADAERELDAAKKQITKLQDKLKWYGEMEK